VKINSVNSSNDWNPVNLKGSTVVVTGASSGIGRVCAIFASKAGANVVLIGRDRNRLDQTYRVLSQGRHHIVTQDITEYDKLDSIIAESVEKCGEISGFVHCAGIRFTVPLKSMKPDYYDKLFSVNVIAGFELARIIAKKKYVHENGASFVFISSTMGVVGQAGLVGYCASKGAVISGSKAMAIELAGKNIRVNTIVGGFVTGTGMSEELFKIIPDYAKEAIVKMHPLGLGKPEDIAHCSVFLLSQSAKWITGAVIPVDGGYTAG